MRKIIAESRMLLGLGLAATLMFGCQQPGTVSGTDQVEEKSVDQAPEDVALKLMVRQTEECRSLREKVHAAREAGQAPGDLEADFIARCVEEVKSGDSSRIVVPIDLQPDPDTRCRWIVAQIDGGREELVIKFRYYCPDECMRIAALADTAPREKYCHDTVPTPVAYCDSLRELLRTALLDSAALVRVKRELEARCGSAHPPVDTGLTDCQLLRLEISKADTNSADYDRLLAKYQAGCIEPKPMTYCDSLKRLLASARLDSAAYARIEHELAALCGTDRPPVDTLGCDDIRARLAGLSADSDEHVRLKTHYHDMCVHPEGPTAECEAYKARLAKLDPASEDYAEARAIVAEKCLEAAPVH